MSKREPKERDLQKQLAKAFIESISRKCFGYNYKNLVLTKQARGSEFKYKLTILKREAFDKLSQFHAEIQNRFTDFKVTYTGSINSKTSREEWHIELIAYGNFIQRVQNEQTPTRYVESVYPENFDSQSEAQLCL